MFRQFRLVPSAALSGLNPVEDTRAKEIDIDNLVAGKVCMRCNNGWMSRLEDAAKPLLVDSARRAPLGPVEAETLAWWFAKTAAVVNVSQPYRLLWPSERRHALADQNLGHVLVTLARARRSNENYVQATPGSVRYLGDGPSTSALRSIALTHQCSIQVGTLVGTVLSLPPEIQPVPVRSRRTLLYDRGISHAVSLRSVARVNDKTEAFTDAFTPQLTPSAFFAR